MGVRDGAVLKTPFLIMERWGFVVFGELAFNDKTVAIPI
jgi:hypothetical protein